MDLIAATYKNIGPFRDKLVTVDFKKGKYLIKAPIGTGKSFLFFDGPLFGLYWSSKSVGRPILNMRSEQGYVKLIFEDRYGQKWLIQRDISRTSGGGEKVVSSLFRLNKQDIDLHLDSALPNIVNRWMEIDSLLVPYLEAEEFKSSRELQKTLELLIPPKEVFLTTSFLMQDSDNIFEMMPSERIKVFKEMFGLLDVDMAKEKVADHRKEIRGQIKALEDTTIINEKLKQALDRLYMEIKKLVDYKLEVSSSNVDRFLADYQLLGNKVNISSFDLSLSPEDIKPWEEIVKSKIQQHQHLKTSYEEKQSQLNDLKRQVAQISEQTEQLERQKTHLKQEIEQINQLDFEKLEKQKKELVHQLSELERKVDWTQLGLKKGDYSWVFVFFKELEEEGKRLGQQAASLKEKLDTLMEQKNKIEKILKDLEKGGAKYQQLLQKEKETLKTTLQTQLNDIEGKLKHLQATKEFLETRLKEVTKKLQNLTHPSFWCKHINADCPLVKEIWEKVFGISGEGELKDQAQQLKADLSDVQSQIEQFLEQKKILESKLQNIEKEIDISAQVKQEKEQILSTWNLKELEEQIDQTKHQLSQQQKALEAKREEYKNLKGVEFKKEIWPQWEELTKKIRELDTQIEALKAKKQEKENLISQLKKIEWELTQLNQRKADANKQLEQMQKLLEELKNKLEEVDINYLEQISENIQQIKTTLVQIQDLLKDFGWRKKELEKLKEKEKILKNLTVILGKELMVVILQNFLPALEDQINSLLAEVVDFQLRFSMKEAKSGEQQLDIKIIDIRGEREVKSLSGGQKVVLRLAWILSVSRVLNARFLFLDETINNLDVEAVGRVARMLKHFLDKSPIEKFYVVTHSSQIQNMDIWDQIVEINP